MKCNLSGCDIAEINSEYPNRDIDFRFHHKETGTSFLLESMSFSGIASEEIRSKEESRKRELESDYNQFINSGKCLLIGPSWTLYGDIRETRKSDNSFTSFLDMFQYIAATGDSEADFIKSQEIAEDIKVEVDGFFYNLKPPEDEHDFSIPEILFSSSGWVSTDKRTNRNLIEKVEHKLGESPNIDEPVIFYINYLDERPEFSMHIHNASIDFNNSLFNNVSAVLIADPRFFSLEGFIAPQMFINPNARYPIPWNILEKAPWHTMKNGIIEEPKTEIYDILGHNKHHWESAYEDFLDRYESVDLDLYT